MFGLTKHNLVSYSFLKIINNFMIVCEYRAETILTIRFETEDKKEQQQKETSFTACGQTWL